MNITRLALLRFALAITHCHVAALALVFVFVFTPLLGCSALSPTKTSHPTFYSLDASQPTVAPLAALPSNGQTLIVNPPHAAAGFDSSRIMYLREPFKLAYFAQSEWLDPPARMLGPLLVGAIAESASFRAVALTSAIASGDLRLDTEIIRLQHEFLTQPSRVRFTLRAYLVDDRTRRVLAWREFDATITSKSEDAHGGVIAANLAVQAVLKELSVFLAARER